MELFSRSLATRRRGGFAFFLIQFNGNLHVAVGKCVRAAYNSRMTKANFLWFENKHSARYFYMSTSSRSLNSARLIYENEELSMNFCQQNKEIACKKKQHKQKCQHQSSKHLFLYVAQLYERIHCGEKFGFFPSRKKWRQMAFIEKILHAWWRKAANWKSTGGSAKNLFLIETTA